MERRQFLIAGLVGTAAVATGVVLWPGAEPVAPFSDTQQALVRALVAPVLEGVAPPEVVEAQADAVVRGVGATIATLPPGSQAQLQQLFELLDQRLALLAMTGSLTPILARQPAELAAMLAQWRHHFLDTLVVAYQGLKELILATWYAEPDHWGPLDYQKPQWPGGRG
ncbi:TAT leader-containing periplasmic protein [Ferrimonas balearica]|uniref:TAT leader-containing periplasmic protein n=1 Tax=Ferrimonas balearica TaxID=44012 RepID=UPI001C99AED5|nr:TAT leader-containing periplasmic protein [Ferrimonas balearica]MBY5993055.1 TAT leader-containing periplasmic protein [Ferrimonas balearica]